MDSLKLIAEAGPTHDKIDALIELALEIVQKDNVRALYYASKAHDLSWTIGDTLRIVKSGRLKGQLLRRVDRLEESLSVLKIVRPIAKRNLEKVGTESDRVQLINDYKKILNALALGYTFKGIYDEALSVHFESLVIREAEGDQKEIGITLNNIGLAYYLMGNPDVAMGYYQRSLLAKEKSKEPKLDLDVLLINIGLCFNGLEKYSEAQESFNKAIAIDGDDIDPKILMQAKFGLGASYCHLKNYSKAYDYFDVSYQLAIKFQDRRWQAENLYYLAVVSVGLGDHKKAEEFLIKGETLSNGMDYNKQRVNFYHEFSSLYLKQKRFEEASKYQERYIKLKDSLISEKLVKNVAAIQTKFEERENLKTIREKDAVLALREETLRRKNAENNFYIVVTLLVFSLSGLLLILFRLTRRANERLEDRVDKRTRDLNAANDNLQKVIGEMDHFIYKTSHDIRGPLASLKGICNIAMMDVKDEVAVDYLNKLNFTVDKLFGILTRLLIINQINHAMMAANAINFEEMFEEILLLERKKGVPKRLKISYEIGKGFVLRSDRELLRIVMENLIDNAIKFSNDSELVEPFVKIEVTADEKSVYIRVIDNGVGVNEATKERIFEMFIRASERSETGGIGLYLTKLATSRLEGSINYSATDDQLTVFTVKLPLDLGPTLMQRNESERIREYERRAQPDKQNPNSPT